MRALVFHQYGSVDVLQQVELDRPVVAPDAVLIRVVAAGVNPADSVFRRGDLKLIIRLKFPFIPGLDVAGVVAEVGANVTKFRPGDAVYAMLPNAIMGGYAEYVAVAETCVAPMPESLTFGEAAALPCAALTALQSLRDKLALRPGGHVLINGGSGGVGTFAVQIAKIMGATVTATCSDRNLDLVRSLGADAVIDYNSTDVTAGDARYDAVFDAVGVLPFDKIKRVLCPGGAMVTVNFNLANPLAMLRARFDRQQRKLKSILVQPVGADLDTLREWVEAGKLRPVIDKVYPLEDAPEAQRHSDTRRTRGKIVLAVDTDRVNEKRI
jgi:2-desacetyl-2-hydroxyethyl bacteriochlorophyllide A dehydrogenase